MTVIRKTMEPIAGVSLGNCPAVLLLLDSACAGQELPGLKYLPGRLASFQGNGPFTPSQVATSTSQKNSKRTRVLDGHQEEAKGLQSTYSQGSEKGFEGERKEMLESTEGPL